MWPCFVIDRRPPIADDWGVYKPMDEHKILVIDDDPDLASMLDQALSRAGAQVHTAHDGKDGLRAFYAQQPDLVILDVVMPVLDGWQTLARIRELSDVPVIMLTVQGTEAEIVHGLDLGAVDYVTKPFSMRILVARIEAALRVAGQRSDAAVPASYDDGHLRIELEERRVFVGGVPEALTDTEFRLLAYLVENAGQVLSQEQIVSRVWGPAYAEALHYVRAYIRRLRLKVESDPAKPVYIMNARGVGYYFAGRGPDLAR